MSARYCIAWMHEPPPEALRADCLSCPVVQGGRVCPCECRTCKQAWFAAGRPIVRERPDRAGVGPMRNPAKRLADWQVSALLSFAATGECPTCWQMVFYEWLSSAGRDSVYDRLSDALDRAGCTRFGIVTPESMLRELEQAGLA